MIGDEIDALITLWRYEVPLVNKRTGERQIALVRLEPHEQCHALWVWLENGPEGPGGPDGCVANLYASSRALVGLDGNEWEPSYPEIVRIKVLH